MLPHLFPAVFTVLFARLSYYESQNNENGKINLISKTLNFIFCMSLPMFAGLYILMPHIVNLICGKDFYLSINTARIMSPLLILSSYSGFLGGQVLISLNKEKTYMFCMIGASIVDVILNFIFIPELEAFGAALATLLTETIILFTYTIILRKILIQTHILKNLFQYIVATLIMALIVLIEYRFIHNIVLSLIICVLSGIIVYAISLILQKNTIILELIKEVKLKTHNVI